MLALIQDFPALVSTPSEACWTPFAIAIDPADDETAVAFELSEPVDPAD